MGVLTYFLLLICLTIPNDSPSLRRVRVGTRQTRKLLSGLLGTFLTRVQTHLLRDHTAHSGLSPLTSINN